MKTKNNIFLFLTFFAIAIMVGPKIWAATVASYAEYWTSPRIFISIIPLSYITDTSDTTNCSLVASGDCRDFGSPVGKASNYSIGSAIVTDNSTGLVWQKCSLGQNVTDCTGTATNYNWQNAIDECATSTVGGFTNWRLPSIREFTSIIKTDVIPTIDATYFPHTADYYWSSTAKSEAYYVAFPEGVIFSSSKTIRKKVRCVR